MSAAEDLARTTEPGGHRPRSVPPSSVEPLRALGAVLLEDVDALADRLTVMIMAHEPAYAERDMVDELRAACRANLQRGMQVIAGRVPEGVDPREASRHTGVLRARQGVPLESVLHAFRLGGRVMWEGLLQVSRVRFDGVHDEALLDAAAFVWRVSDDSSSAMVDAYRLEELRSQSHDLSRRHAVLDGLVEGRGREPGFAREAAVVLGLPESGPLLCVVAPGGGRDQDAATPDPLRGAAEGLSAAAVRSVWFPRTRETVVLVGIDARGEGVVLDALRRCVRGAVGVSPVVDGLAEVDVAHRLARTAAATLTGPGLAVLDERLPEALLVDRPELVPRLVTTALGGLLDLPAADRDQLLQTLDRLLACGGSPTHAAAALFCHRNTVIYRMRRIEAVTGRSVGDPRDRLLLTLGLMATRMREPGGSVPDHHVAPHRNGTGVGGEQLG